MRGKGGEREKKEKEEVGEKEGGRKDITPEVSPEYTQVSGNKLHI